MRLCYGMILRFFAVGLLGIVGLVNGRPGRTMAETLPLIQGEIAAGVPREDPTRQDDADAQHKARTLELANEVVRRCKAATALVELRSSGSGSCVCVSGDGLFVTNHHVVAGVGLGGNVRLVVYSGQKDQRVLEARVVKLDEDDDLALLKVDARPGEEKGSGTNGTRICP